MLAASVTETPKPLFGYRRFWAHRLGPAPFLPTTRAEMDLLGWDVCDVIIVTGDAYVDHPSFGMAIVGRLLEAQGFRVGIIAQPDWRSADAFAELGPPALFWGVTGGNMDSMVNRYTSDRRPRSDDAYSPDGAGGLRPDRTSLVYAQRCREVAADVPLIIGGIEASLRRIAHYDYWSEKVRRSILVDAKADLLVYGNGERAIVEIAHRLAASTPIGEIRDVRGTAFLTRTGALRDGFTEIDSTSVDRPGPITPPPDPYAMEPERSAAACATGAGPEAPEAATAAPLLQLGKRRPADRARTVVRLPSFDDVTRDRVLYAHASRLLHLESNPGNARALVQRHGDRDVWINPPPLPLTTAEMDRLYELPYQRVPHPAYGEARIPAYEMIRFSVTILRGCFGGCSFCSITEHEGRIIQSRSEASVLREVRALRRLDGFHGTISDVGGPTANMYAMRCKSDEIETACRKLSCVHPGICENLVTDHAPLVRLLKRVREEPGVKHAYVASGVRYDLAERSPEFIAELARHHTGGQLSVAPEHNDEGVLDKMKKPPIESYERFAEEFQCASREAGREQHLVPYFISGHPGSTLRDMVKLALWLRARGMRPRQVQDFIPTPMAMATSMYYSGLDPFTQKPVFTARTMADKRLQKALLLYWDPAHHDEVREALRVAGRADLIGTSPNALAPPATGKGSLPIYLRKGALARPRPKRPKPAGPKRG